MYIEPGLADFSSWDQTRHISENLSVFLNSLQEVSIANGRLVRGADDSGSVPTDPERPMRAQPAARKSSRSAESARNALSDPSPERPKSARKRAHPGVTRPPLRGRDPRTSAEPSGTERTYIHPHQGHLGINLRDSGGSVVNGPCKRPCWAPPLKLVVPGTTASPCDARKDAQGARAPSPTRTCPG